MRRLVLFVLSAAVGCGLLSQLPSRAAAEPVLLIVPERQDSEQLDAFHRLEAELRIHHFETVSLAARLGNDPTTTLAAYAREQHALAAIAFLGDSDRPTLAIWLVDRQTRRAGLRTLQIGHGADAASLIAVRAVDLLRANLEHYGKESAAEGSDAAAPPKPPKAATTPPTKAATAAPTQPSAAAAAPVERDEDHTSSGADGGGLGGPRRRFWLSAELMAIRPGSRFGVAIGPALAAWYWPHDRLGAGLYLAAPLSSTELQTSSGSARLHQELAWVEGRWRALSAGRVSAGPVLGVGAYFVQAKGTVVLPLLPRDDRVWTWLLSAGLHLEVALLPQLSAAVSARALWTYPRVGVSVARDSVRLDSPALEASLGLSLGL
jgi:hypothetical protein